MSFLEFKQYCAYTPMTGTINFHICVGHDWSRIPIFRPKLKYNLAIVDVGKLTFLKIIATVF